MYDRFSSATLSSPLAAILIAGLIAASPTTVLSQQAPDADVIRAGRFDNGKMWTFDYPPLEYFKEEYGMAPDEAWFEHARLSALRLPNCTASFVSPNGLVMTNHHCTRGTVAQLSGEGGTLLETGFSSAALSEELSAPGLYVDQLVEIEDVTDEVYGALESAQTIAERASARSEVIESIQQRIAESRGGAGSGYVAQVISYFSGGRYSAYTFKRYSDVRLVVTPEIKMGHFGGDPDNFTFPRYALDMSFLRVYGDDGQPLKSEHYFKWGKGAEEGDVVFVVGNPGSTNRLESVAQLEYRRDVQEKYIYEFLVDRLASLRADYRENPSEQARATMLNISNVEKLYGGRVKGLNDPALMGRREDSERKFLEAINADPSLSAEYGDLIDALAKVAQQKYEYAADFASFLSLQPQNGISSATLRRGILAHEYLKRMEDGASAEAIEESQGQLLAVGDQSSNLDARFFTSRIAIFQRHLADDEAVTAFMAGRSPEQVADEVFANTLLSSAAIAAEAVQSGKLTMDDPVVRLAAAFAQRRADAQSAAAGLGAQEAELLSRRGRAQYDVYGLTEPPDATFSLRLADGVVKGYPYNGTEAPPYTTFYGLFDHYHSYRGSSIEDEWSLPERWLDLPESFDLSTPINIVATADIIGGNSGSPMVNKDLEVVGLVFDGNIESLPSSFIFVPDFDFRTVAVDARGIIETLDHVYDMDRIVHELKTGELVPTEEAADAMGTN